MLPSGISTLSWGCQTSGLFSKGLEDGSGDGGVGNVDAGDTDVDNTDGGNTNVGDTDVGAERAGVGRSRNGARRCIVACFGGEMRGAVGGREKMHRDRHWESGVGSRSVGDHCAT
jgi:hypothetical protein